MRDAVAVVAVPHQEPAHEQQPRPRDLQQRHQPEAGCPRGEKPGNGRRDRRLRLTELLSGLSRRRARPAPSASSGRPTPASPTGHRGRRARLLPHPRRRRRRLVLSGGRRVSTVCPGDRGETHSHRRRRDPAPSRPGRRATAATARAAGRARAQRPRLPCRRRVPLGVLARGHSPLELVEFRRGRSDLSDRQTVAPTAVEHITVHSAGSSKSAGPGFVGSSCPVTAAPPADLKTQSCPVQ